MFRRVISESIGERLREKGMGLEIIEDYFSELAEGCLLSEVLWDYADGWVFCRTEVFGKCRYCV